MLSIGRFAQLAQVSPRTVRYYESIGLVKSASRGENNYRYYDENSVKTVTRIRDLQELGFRLEEIKKILLISQGQFAASVRQRLNEVESELLSLQVRRQKLAELLSVLDKIDSGESINNTEKENYMEAITAEIMSGLQRKTGRITETHLRYLERDRSYHSDQQREFLRAVQSCLQFAQQKKLTLGPARGSSPASIVLYALGLNKIDPTEHGLSPERLLTQPPNIHIDVEFERGQEFVDFCRETTKKLSFGQIHAFKMPLLDILNNVDASLSTPLHYDKIDNNSELVLNLIRNGDIENIFMLDMTKDSLIMKYEDQLPGYAGFEKMSEYLKSQPIVDFNDVINVTAMWRPFSQIMIDRLERYKSAKTQSFKYPQLDESLQESLRSNFGMIIYHEDILRIMSYYTGWNLQRCNQLRRQLSGFAQASSENKSDYKEFKSIVPTEIAELIEEENKHSFCKPHAAAFADFTKKTSVVKSLHPELYFEEIEKWEQKNGFRWDDIGVKFKGVSLLQS